MKPKTKKKTKLDRIIELLEEILKRLPEKNVTPYTQYITLPKHICTVCGLEYDGYYHLCSGSSW